MCVQSEVSNPISLCSIFNNILYCATFRRTTTVNLNQMLWFTHASLRGICGGQNRCESIFYEYSRLPVSIVLPTLNCHRLISNIATNSLICIFHSCLVTYLHLASPVCWSTKCSSQCPTLVMIIMIMMTARVIHPVRHIHKSPPSLCPHTRTLCVPTNSSHAPQHLSSRRKPKRCTVVLIEIPLGAESCQSLWWLNQSYLLVKYFSLVNQWNAKWNSGNGTDCISLRLLSNL
jgi:hypothetical protein